MKKALVILMIFLMVFSNIIVCFAEIDEKENNKYLVDLQLLRALEPADKYKEILLYMNEMDSILIKQKEVINALGSLFYLGYFSGDFEAAELKSVYEWESEDFDAHSPLFSTDYFGNYSNYRFKENKNKSSSFLYFIIESFIEKSRDDYNDFLDTETAGLVDYKRLMLLLQDKLLEKLYSIEDKDIDSFITDVLELRNSQNLEKQRNYIYELFESRVRLSLLETLIEENNKSIKQMSQNIKVWIKSSTNGSLHIFNSKAENDTETDIGFVGSTNSFSGSISVDLLLDNINSNITLELGEGDAYHVPVDELWNAIAAYKGGCLILNVDELVKDLAHYTDKAENNQLYEDNLPTDKQRELLSIQLNSHGEAAKEVVKRLNKYDIYKALINQGIRNSFTDAFDSEKIQWKSDLMKRLLDFGNDSEEKTDKPVKYSFAKLILFIRDYVEFERVTIEKTSEDRRLLLAFRQSVLQFKPIEEANLWILDLLYSIMSDE